jgi:hypothetical protein
VHFSGAQTSGTSVSGIINSNTTWTQAGSPYTFTGPVSVNAGVTLTIQTGVTVNFNGNTLQVNGTLQAIGTSTDQIQFNANNNQKSEISFMPSSSNWNQQTSSGCIIQNANLTVIVAISDASPLVNFCNFSSDFVGMWVPTLIGIMSGSPIISNNTINYDVSFYQDIGITIFNNQGFPIICDNIICNNYGESWVGVGISDNPGNAIISNNSISGWGCGIYAGDNVTVEGNLCFNNVCGVLAESSGLIENNSIVDNSCGINFAFPESSAKVLANNIYDNQYNFEDNTINNVNATYNWWGTTDTQAINQTIYDYKDNYSEGNVTFVPFLTSPNAQAPTFVNPTPTSTPTPSPSPSPTSTPSPNTPPTPTPRSIHSNPTQQPTSTPSTNNSNSPSPTPTPSAPEFPALLIIVPFLVSLFCVAVVVRHRKTANLSPPLRAA